MTNRAPGLTVLIATYNRTDILRQTLDALNSVERTGIDCDIVIIDNNSTDNTAEVVKEYGDRLPLSLLRETRPGKTCALNKALRECTLRDIVVFTDDDITPAKNWFQEIVSSTTKWPEVMVFGGKIEVMWPDNKQPEWAVTDWIKAFGFSWHHYADGEVLYKPSACPSGGNFWVRKVVFQKVPFFDETIGPSPKNRIMGGETLFLRELQSHGIQMLYYPKSEVRHRILVQACLIPALRLRGYRFGRGQVRLHGWHRYNLYLKSKIFWCMVFAADYFYTSLRFMIGYVLRDSKRNCEITVGSMIRFGQLRETTGQVLDRFKRHWSS
jgi:glycosyltransferase involved in cell wall biosynthesis